MAVLLAAVVFMLCVMADGVASEMVPMDRSESSGGGCDDVGVVFALSAGLLMFMDRAHSVVVVVASPPMSGESWGEELEVGAAVSVDADDVEERRLLFLVADVAVAFMLSAVVFPRCRITLVAIINSGLISGVIDAVEDVVPLLLLLLLLLLYLRLRLDG